MKVLLNFCNPNDDNNVPEIENAPSKKQKFNGDDILESAVKRNSGNNEADKSSKNAVKMTRILFIFQQKR